MIAAALLLGGSDLACGTDTAVPDTVHTAGASGQAGAGAGTPGGSGPGGASPGGASGVGGLIFDSGVGGSGGGLQPDAGCAVGEVPGRLIPANLLFVVD